MRIQIEDVSFGLIDGRTRLPFRFGIATLTQAPTLTVRVSARADGASTVGYASDLLVPKWFEKDPDKSVQDDVLALVKSARTAARLLMRPHEPSSVFDLWYSVYREAVLSRHYEVRDALVRGFGVALVERALMDAACRAAGVSIFDALKDDLFEFTGGTIYPEVKDLGGGALPAPLDTVTVRHTIGLLDPLRVDELDGDGDGIPRALEEDIDAYGLTQFKLKLAGDADADVARAVEVAGIVRDRVGDDAMFSLDGNEQFEDLDGLKAVLDATARESNGAWLLERVRWIEQPLSRANTFDRARHKAIEEVAAVAPLIIDEADSGFVAFRTAHSIGYRGVSVKNCKGVFRALVNHGLCAAFDDGSFQTGEDLTNLPVLALQQDLATMAALGLDSVERNGHHYFAGLDHLPEEEARAALEAHPDLYVEDGGRIRLKIEGGQLALGSLATPGFGTSLEPSLDARTSPDDWTCPF